MSDFFRIPFEPRVASQGAVTLARLAHVAEDTGDDVLLMQVADAAERLPGEGQAVYALCYVDFHSESEREANLAAYRRVFPSNRQEPTP